MNSQTGVSNGHHSHGRLTIGAVFRQLPDTQFDLRAWLRANPTHAPSVCRLIKIGRLEDLGEGLCIKAQAKRRDHAGGSHVVAFESTVADTRQPVSAADFDYDAVDAALGVQEPGEDSTVDRYHREREALGIVKLVAWILDPLVRFETFRTDLLDLRRPGETTGTLHRVRTVKKIAMQPARCAWLKTLSVQLCIRPQMLGLANPSLQAIASYAGVSKQCFGRVFLSLRAFAPGFVTSAVKSDAVREILKEAHKAVEEETIDDAKQLGLNFD